MYTKKYMNFLKSLLVIFFLSLAAGADAQDHTLNNPKLDSLDREMDYVIVHYAETRVRVGINITHPDGHRVYDSKRYKRKALNDLGDYGWLMTHLNTYFDQGYTIKSHTMTVPFSEGADTYYHIYILEKPVFEKFGY